MKKYIIMLGAVCALSLNSCDWLDVDPVSEITDSNYWTSAEHFDSFMTGLHSRFRTHSYNFVLLGEFRSDIFGDMPFGGEASQGMERFPFNTISEDSPGISNYGNFYTCINQVNLMIHKTEKTQMIPEDSKRYYLGQSYGIRAYYYFHLLRSWGKAVIVTEPTLGSEIDLGNLPKAASSEEEVMNQILADIDNSLSNFDSNYKFKNKNYWSKAASLMLKAEVMLWKAKQMNGGNEAAVAAKNALVDLTSNVSLSLMPEFADVFAYNKKRNEEIIFSFKSEKDEFDLWNGSFSGSFLPQTNYMVTYYDEAGNKWDSKTENLFGLMRMQVQQKHYETTFDKADKRWSATLKGVFNQDGSYAGCFPYKFQGTNLEGFTNRSMIDDCVVYRYADALLLLAEAKAYLGESAADEINQIRRRAYGDEYFDANQATVAYPNQPQDASVEEAILKERLCEFFFEGKRWYDLRRFGNEYVFKYTMADSSDPRKLLWPIDKGTLTKNTALSQTPGYEIAGVN